MSNYIKVLYNYRDLLVMWTVREVKIRYKQSLLGAGWAIVQPLALTLIFTLVFSYFVRVPTDGAPYPIFAYSALVPWTLLATAIAFAAPSLVNNIQLLSKIYFPREVLPLASIGAALFDFLIAIAVFVVMMLLYGISMTTAWYWLPVLVLVQLALITGVALLLAGVNVFYRDVRFVVPLALQLWMYASPIIYPLSSVPEWLRPAYMLNPMAGIINSYRRVMLQGEPPVPEELLTASLLSALMLVIGYVYFKRVEPEFADVM
jgi:lipopolysaccharide transport system permease protein